MNFYRVNYNFVTPSGTLRTGAIVVQAKDEGSAQKLAELKIPPSQRELARITKTKLYAQGPAAKR